jgi:hypothetical protein
VHLHHHQQQQQQQRIPLFANPSTNNKLCRLLDHTTFDDFERSAAAAQLSKIQRDFQIFQLYFKKLCASLACSALVLKYHDIM